MNAEFTDYNTQFSLEEKIKNMKKELRLLNKFRLNNVYHFKDKYVSLKNPTYIDMLTTFDSSFIGSGAYGQTFNLQDAGKICFKVAEYPGKMNLIHETLAGYVLSDKFQNFVQTLGYKLDINSRMDENLYSYSIILFMEFIEGGKTLTKIADKFSTDEVKSIMFQVIFTMLDAGKLYKFNHNDLHTDNIMIEYSEDPVTIKYLDGYQIKTHYIAKIIDFGISRFEYDNTIFHASNRSNFSWCHDIQGFVTWTGYYEKFREIGKDILDLLPKVHPKKKYTTASIDNQELLKLKEKFSKILKHDTPPKPTTPPLVEKRTGLKFVPTNIIELNILGTNNESLKRKIYEEETENVMKEINFLETVKITPEFDPLHFDDIDYLERKDSLETFKSYANVVVNFLSSYIETVEKIDALKKYRTIKVSKQIKDEISEKINKIQNDSTTSLKLYLPEVIGGADVVTGDDVDSSSSILTKKISRRRLQLLSKNFFEYKNLLILIYNFIQYSSKTKGFP